MSWAISAPEPSASALAASFCASLNVTLRIASFTASSRPGATLSARDECGRRHLDHRAHADVGVEALALGGQLGLGLAHGRARLPDLVQPADDGQQDGNRVVGTDAQERA